ncbi:2005_t:CDS:2, partial [Entrophospora sp. SA101]
MENFLLTYVPLSTITVASALYKHLESGKWSGNHEQEVEYFVETLKSVLQRVPSDDNERLRKLQSFGTGIDLKQRVSDALDYVHSLIELNALVLFFYHNAVNNFELLKHEVHKLAISSFGDDKEMWENVEKKLREINIEELGYDHPLCSDQASSASAERKKSSKCAKRPDYMVIIQVKSKKIEIGYLETGRPDSSLDKQIRDLVM